MAENAVVMIDPLIRHDLEPTGWTWLDDAVSAVNAPVAVLLTAPWHERSTRDVVERYRARVWIDPSARARVSDLPSLGAVPAGIDVFKPRGVDEGQVAFFIVSEHALVTAEFFLGAADGLRVCPSPRTGDMSEFAESLSELTRLPIERVLVAHGPPVLEKRHAAILAALHSFQVS
jgi:glyoxylase-like metal-dependent hydrolase (beta-lactamase superfamily II)